MYKKSWSTQKIGVYSQKIFAEVIILVAYHFFNIPKTNFEINLIWVIPDSVIINNSPSIHSCVLYGKKRNLCNQDKLRFLPYSEHTF